MVKQKKNEREKENNGALSELVNMPNNANTISIMFISMPSVLTSQMHFNLLLFDRNMKLRKRTLIKRFHDNSFLLHPIFNFTISYHRCTNCFEISFQIDFHLLTCRDVFGLKIIWFLCTKWTWTHSDFVPWNAVNHFII